jgi:hypothetical protein
MQNSFPHFKQSKVTIASTMNYIQYLEVLNRSKEIFLWLLFSHFAARIFLLVSCAHLIDFNVGSRLRYEIIFFRTAYTSCVLNFFFFLIRKKWATCMKRRKIVRRNKLQLALKGTEWPYKGQRNKHNQFMEMNYFPLNQQNKLSRIFSVSDLETTFFCHEKVEKFKFLYWDGNFHCVQLLIVSCAFNSHMKLLYIVKPLTSEAEPCTMSSFVCY